MKWKSRSDIELQFSPNNWGYAANYPERAYMAECPTLQNYDITYGESSSMKWVHMQVLALYGSSSNKDTGIADGIRIFAQAFASEVKGYKLSELMLFFSRYKAGKYDSSYASFDARRIGNAFFKEFIPERNREIDIIERKRTAQRRNKSKKGCISYEQYLEIKQRAEKGDKEAIKLLQKPK